MTTELPISKAVEVNPTQQEMREWALRLTPGIQRTEFENLNYRAQVTARLSESTFFVTDDESNPKNTISRSEYERWALLQNAYISTSEMILIEGYIGADKDFRTGCRLFIEKTQANIAAMQQQLYFPKDDEWWPEFTVIYTPGVKTPGKPNDRSILVDLDNYETRILGSDYFGESKMAGLRMWNHLIYQRGGLALHSGLKVFPGDRAGEMSILILGLSGTGKTTTTFRQQLESLPVQDDFNAFMPGGTVRASEAGCFAKTFGLDPIDEPGLYAGVTSKRAWLENTHVGAGGEVDFFDRTRTENGRSTFTLEEIVHRSPQNVPRATKLLLLNRNENVIPAVVKLPRDQAAAYFMLGETKGTSAGGTAEAGKSLRVPGTNPFFFDNDALQGNRLLDLLDSVPDLTVYLMNTGSIGGPEGDPAAKDVRISDSSLLLESLVMGTIQWAKDPDFGYEIAASGFGLEDHELVQPLKLYERQGRSDEYRAIVAELKSQRRSYLRSFPGLAREIVESI